MSTALLQVASPFIIFFVGTIVSGVLIILLPSFIGKKMLPTYSITKKEEIDMPKDSLYNILVNYKNYPTWKPFLKKTEQQTNAEGKTVWTEYYKFSRIKNIFTETKKIENSLLIYSVANKEYAAVYSFEINEKDEKHSILAIKETIYFIAPYLRFFYGFLFYKKRFVNNIFRLIKKYQSKQD